MELVYRQIYAVVPRKVLAKWHHEPWSLVLTAAETGEDGMSVLHGTPRLWQGPQMGKPNPPDVAYLAQGQHDWTERTVLFQQNW